MPDTPFPLSPPILIFRGHCLDAFQCYAETLGGHIESMDTSAGPHRRVTHAVIHLCGQILAGMDLPPHTPAMQEDAGIALLLDCDSATQARGHFEHLSRGGRVTTALSGTGWGLAGAVLDGFGTPWVIRCPHAAPARLLAKPEDAKLRLKALRLSPASGRGEDERTGLGPAAPLHQQAQQDPSPIRILREARGRTPIEVRRGR